MVDNRPVSQIKPWPEHWSSIQVIIWILALHSNGWQGTWPWPFDSPIWYTDGYDICASSIWILSVIINFFTDQTIPDCTTLQPLKRVVFMLTTKTQNFYGRLDHAHLLLHGLLASNGIVKKSNKEWLHIRAHCFANASPRKIKCLILSKTSCCQLSCLLSLYVIICDIGNKKTDTILVDKVSFIHLKIISNIYYSMLGTKKSFM